MVRIGNAVNMIILNENNEVLLLKRAKDDGNYPEFYCFPGGGLDINETFDEALIREIKEEAGVDIIEKNYFKSFYYVSNEEFHVRTLYFYGKVKGEVKINEESSSFDWFSLDEALKIKLAFNQSDIMKEFAEFYEK